MTPKEITFFCFAGLIRGAVAFALVLRLPVSAHLDPRRSTIITTTLTLVIVTTVIFGALLPFVSIGLFGKIANSHGTGHTKVVESISENLIQSIHSQIHAELQGDEQEEEDTETPKIEIEGEGARTESDVTGVSERWDRLKGRKSVFQCWRTFDDKIMKPMFVYNYSKERQKRILRFYEFYLEEGERLEQEYEETGTFIERKIHDYDKRKILEKERIKALEAGNTEAAEALGDAIEEAKEESIISRNTLFKQSVQRPRTNTLPVQIGNHSQKFL